MTHQDIDRRSPMMHRIAGAVLRQRRLIAVMAFFAVVSILASLAPIVAMVVKILLTAIVVLILNLITFRGSIVQELVRKLIQYFAPQHVETTGTHAESIQPSLPDL